MILWMLWIALSDWEDKPTWLLVPLTAVYAMLTLLMFAAARQSALAATRSAQAIETSVYEQRRDRFLAHAVFISFSGGLNYHYVDEQHATVRMRNVYSRPILGLQVLLWRIEVSSSGERSVKFSTMLEAIPRDIDPETRDFEISLGPSERTEQERVALGQEALARYRRFNRDAIPMSALCLIWYYDRALNDFATYVHDLQRQPQSDRAKLDVAGHRGTPATGEGT